MNNLRDLIFRAVTSPLNDDFKNVLEHSFQNLLISTGAPEDAEFKSFLLQDLHRLTNSSASNRVEFQLLMKLVDAVADSFDRYIRDRIAFDVLQAVEVFKAVKKEEATTTDAGVPK